MTELLFLQREGSSRISKQTTVKHPATERLGGLVFPLVLGASLREANCGSIVAAYCKCWFNFLKSYRNPLC